MIITTTITFTIASCVLVSTFASFEVKFDANPQCNADNWGVPNQSKKTFKGKYDATLRIPCESQWKATTRPFSEAHKMATAIYYKNNHDYDNFKAIDWIPENREKYGSGSTWGKSKNTDYLSKKPKSFLSSECVLNDEDDSTWTLTRIGPIKSTGLANYFMQVCIKFMLQ